jgi:hypothetical protein
MSASIQELPAVIPTLEFPNTGVAAQESSEVSVCQSLGKPVCKSSPLGVRDRAQQVRLVGSSPVPSERSFLAQSCSSSMSSETRTGFYLMELHFVPKSFTSSSESSRLAIPVSAAAAAGLAVLFFAAGLGYPDPSFDTIPPFTTHFRASFQ